MATLSAQQQSDQQTQQKERLAAILAVMLLRWFNNLIPKMREELLKNNKDFLFTNELVNVTEILQDSFFNMRNITGNRFINSTVKQIKSVDATYSAPDNETTMLILLALTYPLRAAQQALFVTDTLQKRFDKIILDVLNVEDRRPLDTILREFTTSQRNHLSNMVAKDQTQLAVETLKQDIVTALMANNTNPNLVAIKTWISRLDDEVRVWHQEAHGQQVKYNERYLVGGEHLLNPRDPSGSLPNTLGCRCIDIYTFVLQ